MVGGTRAQMSNDQFPMDHVSLPNPTPGSPMAPWLTFRHQGQMMLGSEPKRFIHQDCTESTVLGARRNCQRLNDTVGVGCDLPASPIGSVS